ncbi:MAG: hypothetical protein K2M00_04960, partial [Muribaculaceae bacterium]|nr:hypothetical protein [Muribaculaceae bacterium]
STENPSGYIGPSKEEQQTQRAKFKLDKIPYGRYKMFAVANVDLTDVDCSTIAALRGKRFEWNSDNISENNQMFGYFTLPGNENETSRGDAPILIVNQQSVSLHSWVRRLVSKVTVSFDASGLYENVRIYVKSVTIHDIPNSCPLGEDNSPNEDDQLIKNGESILYYGDGEGDNSQHTKWKMVLSKGDGIKGNGKDSTQYHSEDAPSLYFFENMQGNYPNDALYDKRQDESAVGTPIDEPEDGPDYKDRIKCGTYIEVEAYYDSRNKDKISQGPIKYRFMLGKNTTFNYNAERNYHYKLTLKFRGWANEADWHISYREYKRTLITPEPYYISYLYGQQMDFPARVLLMEGDDANQFEIKAEIVENNWWPWDRDANNGKGARPAQFVPDGLTGLQDIDGFAWNEPALSIYEYMPYDPKNTTYDYPYGADGSNYVGFLSLRPNTKESEENGGIIGTDADITGAGFGLDPNGYGSNADKYLRWYYKQHNLAVNTYNVKTVGHFDDVDKSYNLKIPMYTRNKEMVPSTDFSGNNPFNSYSRYAKVRFTLLQNGVPISFLNEDGKEEKERIATIYQVPRIENPKAIYRAHNNDAEFKVKLMILPNAGTSKYQTFKSDGPWRASIMVQSESFITLSNDKKTVSTTGEYIEGSTDETIEFTYKPNGTIGENETRCGVIKVEYNDYNCVHLIIVRQGYHKGVQLGNAKWSCYNVYATSRGGSNSGSLAPGTETSVNVALTRSPLSVGSYLKRNQYNYSIREANNDTYGWLAPVSRKVPDPNDPDKFPTKFVYDYSDFNLSTVYIDDSGVTHNRDANWGEIQGFGWTNYGSNNSTQERATRKWADTWTAVGGFQDDVKFAVPTGADFISMRDKCKFGYGVVYGDGAITTADEFKEANGYTDYSNTGGWSTKGVRACVVYDETNGNNVIFPLGALGQARRSCGAPYGSTSWGTVPFEDPGLGTITYGGMRQVLGGLGNQHRPLTYNLYRDAGGIYWIKQPVLTDQGSNISGVNRPNYASWDINYFTIMFNPYDYNSLSGWTGSVYNKSNVDPATCSDALPIKLIYQ